MKTKSNTISCFSKKPLVISIIASAFILSANAGEVINWTDSSDLSTLQKIGSWDGSNSSLGPKK